jgi:pimeloyl-ACP methyl ester carboxylesterase
LSNCGHPALPPIEVTDKNAPALLVRGQMSDLVTEERADEFLARYREIDFVDVGSAGHMVAGGRNDLFAGAVVDFLARHAEAGETDAG